MRHLLFAAVLLTIPMLTLSAPARAIEYPWCSAESINCFYSSFEQCQAAISGLGLDCTRNPRLVAESSDTRADTDRPVRRSGRSRVAR
ncbi:DUF3551 domain-containing protein [Bradyrhizobium prioriisuperbiae]|uniref:DUF3551 domain-containing protein n=1 Tax=Bradyrhizobium prioriisuperbiae TaxID=2854389 RepID=UPI0028EF0D45|nr:DUF3551 domain-containing protein [Bradyrhizobium prioritasuperba]